MSPGRTSVEHAAVEDFPCQSPCLVSGEIFSAIELLVSYCNTLGRLDTAVNAVIQHAHVYRKTTCFRIMAPQRFGLLGVANTVLVMSEAG